MQPQLVSDNLLPRHLVHSLRLPRVSDSQFNQAALSGLVALALPLHSRRLLALVHRPARLVEQLLASANLPLLVSASQLLQDLVNQLRLVSVNLPLRGSVNQLLQALVNLLLDLVNRPLLDLVSQQLQDSVNLLPALVNQLLLVSVSLLVALVALAEVLWALPRERLVKSTKQ